MKNRFQPNKGHHQFPIQIELFKEIMKESNYDMGLLTFFTFKNNIVFGNKYYTVVIFCLEELFIN